MGLKGSRIVTETIESYEDDFETSFGEFVKVRVLEAGEETAYKEGDIVVIKRGFGYDEVEIDGFKYLHFRNDGHIYPLIKSKKRE